MPSSDRRRARARPSRTTPAGAAGGRGRCRCSCRTGRSEGAASPGGSSVSGPNRPGRTPCLASTCPADPGRRRRLRRRTLLAQSQTRRTGRSAPLPAHKGASDWRALPASPPRSRSPRRDLRRRPSPSTRLPLPGGARTATLPRRDRAEATRARRRVRVRRARRRRRRRPRRSRRARGRPARRGRGGTSR